MSDQSQPRQILERLRSEPDKFIDIILGQAAAIKQLQEQDRKLEEQIRDLNDRNGGLQKRIEELETAGFRPVRSASPPIRSGFWPALFAPPPARDVILLLFAATTNQGWTQILDGW